jgi:hypothetical protein
MDQPDDWRWPSSWWWWVALHRTNLQKKEKEKKKELTLLRVPENKPRKIFKKYTHSQPTTENQRY